MSCFIFVRRFIANQEENKTYKLFPLNSYIFVLTGMIKVFALPSNTFCFNCCPTFSHAFNYDLTIKATNPVFVPVILTWVHVHLYILLSPYLFTVIAHRIIKCLRFHRNWSDLISHLRIKCGYHCVYIAYTYVNFLSIQHYKTLQRFKNIAVKTLIF